MSATGNIAQRLVIAIGGNATHPEGIRGTPSEQVEVAARLGDALLPVMELGNELIITHGNGPVVGKILMRQSIARQRVEPMSLDICVAHSQGGIAYLLMQALDRVTLSQVRKWHAEGQFPPGSMGPKIDAAIQFLQGGGRRVMIGRLEDAMPILRGDAGTHIVAD